MKRYGTNELFPASELVVGARKQLARRWGVSVSAYGGQQSAQPGDQTCRILPEQTGRCLKSGPLINWYGASFNGEAYLGRAILSLGVGPASLSTKGYERYGPLLDDPTRSTGVRTQLEAILPLYRSVGFSMIVAHRTAPNVLRSKVGVTSFGFGLSVR
ncbi:MAG: hypothetical protein ACO1Q7_15780 [Gemmatimonas sp.]